MKYWIRIPIALLISVLVIGSASGQNSRLATASDVARYLAGMPVSEGSPLASLTRDPQWLAHSNAMNLSFAKMETRQLSNIRTWRSEMLAPVIPNGVCLYLFGGPDFLYANVFFPDAPAYVLQGLETIDSIPDLLTLPVQALDGTLQNIEISLNSALNYTYFETKDMRENFSRSELKGVLPILFVFIARSGQQIAKVDYISLAPNGAVIDGFRSAVRGVRILLDDPRTGREKSLYYFTADLSNGALSSGIVRFCSNLGPTNSFLKAASYLMYEDSFSTVRNLLLGVSASIVEDDSGIPVRYLTSDRWTLRFFGSYAGPIDLFKKYYETDLYQDFANNSPKPLTFGFGYQINRRTSNLLVAVRHR
ncbi:MAG: hypothetical protein JOZ08_25685 [Verrucomicrobia bacterium]|nr:hypothetical protein [Verrucomicrobiota bacterium]MBV8275232.1 hypothetical protein [Verrucomicrobiota bacterium]